MGAVTVGKIMENILTAEYFINHTNEDFALHTGEGRLVLLRLASVTKLTDYGSACLSRQPFCLLFDGPGPYALCQGTYRLTHPAMGAVEIGLVPIAHHEAGFQYQAVFN